MSTDITDRKEAELRLQRSEEKLRLSEEKFSTAFRVSPDAINITRLNDGMYMEVNEGFTALTGYTFGDVVGKTSLELNIWDNPEDRARLASGLKEHGVVNNLEAQFRRKDGSALIGLMSARIIEIEGETCLLSITRDISDRKQTEEFLRESEKNLRTLMDSMPAGVWWFDTDGNVEYFNSCFTELFGYTRDDIPTLENWFECAYPDPIYRGPYIAARNASIAESLKSGTAVPPREAKITCKDGTQRLIIINTKFALGYTVEIFTDITEREQFHDQLQKMDKLESLGILAGGIAHDFNNILTGIIGNISFARRFLDETHKSSPILLKAEKATTRAADLAHQLLTFAKGGQPIKKAVSIRHLIEETTAFVLHGSNVSSDIKLSEDLVAIDADEGQISQVINNLIINASHAMPGGGTITIRGNNILIDVVNKHSLSPGTYAKLTIADTGCGISEEVQNKIFDPYFTTKPGGSGLGLASAHSIITKHGGHIGVSSIVGKGSTFELLLPASDNGIRDDNTDCVSEIINGQTNVSVLVMDDEEMIRELAALMIEEVGYHAQTCASGKEAITLYKAARDAGSPYSVVIMDLTVPGGMGGREAAEHILKIDPNACLIVSSGYSTDPVMSEFDTFGFCATLLKPYSIEEITKTLATVLSKIQK
jgi:PAS domain S-box-containing protein